MNNKEFTICHLRQIVQNFAVKLSPVLLLLSLLSTANAQQYHFAATHNRTYGIDIGYSYGGWGFVEGGLKTNFQEYYTMPYVGVGVKTDGKVLVAVSTGYGALLNIPQRDLPVIKEGYTTNVLHCVYGTVKAGYWIGPVCVYGSWTASGRNWISAGVVLRSR